MTQQQAVAPGLIPPPPRPRAPVPLTIIAMLGATQIVGYGTIYYSFAILAPAIAVEFATSQAVLFGILSVGLLASGLVSPRLGVLMDRHGAPQIMAWGSAAVTVLLLALALAPGLVSFALLILLLEVVSAAVFYTAAFATLAQFAGPEAQRSITHLTLIAGFASTLFWPLTGYLVEVLGFRGCFALFALMHLGLALPLHLRIVQLARRHLATGAFGRPGSAQTPRFAPLTGTMAQRAFQAVALSFALSAVVMSALAVHLVPVLQAMALGPAAYLVSMLMGPAQVLIRLVDALLWRRLHPLQVALISAVAIPVALLMLVLGMPPLLAGCLFALLFGIGQGLSSIVQGTVPLALFGTAGYGARLGKLAAARLILGAGAPFLFALSTSGIGAKATLWIALAIGSIAVAPLVTLFLTLRRSGSLADRG